MFRNPVSGCCASARCLSLRWSVCAAGFPTYKILCCTISWGCCTIFHFDRVVLCSANRCKLAFTHALKHLDALDTCAVGPRAALDTLRGRLDRPLQSAPMDPAQVIEELARDVDGGLNVTGSGRVFGWGMGGARP